MSRWRLDPEDLVQRRDALMTVRGEESETAKIDTMVAKVETVVERLQEYRTALITAAVTG